MRLSTLICHRNLYAADWLRKQRIKEEVEQTYPSGAKKKVIQYQGKRSNLVRSTAYFEDGKVQSDQFFKNGAPDSTFIIFNKDGSKYKESRFANGKKNGPEISWHENGKIRSEANYIDSVPDGPFITYYKMEKRHQKSPIKLKKEGADITYDTLGQNKHLRTYVNNDMEGIEQEWYPNGKLKMNRTGKKIFSMVHIQPTLKAEKRRKRVIILTEI
jgi:antitoxin component YwqK of YwqJK toxin-antitoxin module